MNESKVGILPYEFLLPSNWMKPGSKKLGGRLKKRSCSFLQWNKCQRPGIDDDGTENFLAWAVKNSYTLCVEDHEAETARIQPESSAILYISKD